ncbi:MULTISPECIES: hypothetical protein [unclassified Blastococcus]
METMHAAGRRNLPPVPRSSTETIPPAADAPVVAPVTVDAAAQLDAGQAFVERLRAAAPALAEAAGAESAVVREVVPPARHRRSRCRVVLRYEDGTETDLTFVGERRRPNASDEDAFDAEITRWLSSGQLRDPAWLVADPEAPDGVAVDVTAWLAAG